jgi:hypothetical protein
MAGKTAEIVPTAPTSIDAGVAERRPVLPRGWSKGLTLDVIQGLAAVNHPLNGVAFNIHPDLIGEIPCTTTEMSVAGNGVDYQSPGSITVRHSTTYSLDQNGRPVTKVIEESGTIWREPQASRVGPYQSPIRTPEDVLEARRSIRKLKLPQAVNIGYTLPTELH